MFFLGTSYVIFVGLFLPLFLFPFFLFPKAKTKEEIKKLKEITTTEFRCLLLLKKTFFSSKGKKFPFGDKKQRGTTT
jgi:hypothetical protein